LFEGRSNTKRVINRCFLSPEDRTGGLRGVIHPKCGSGLTGFGCHFGNPRRGFATKKRRGGVGKMSSILKISTIT